MTENQKMTRDIHNFVWRGVDWKTALDLLSRVSKSEYWIDYLLMDMELLEYYENCKKGIAKPPESKKENNIPF